MSFVSCPEEILYQYRDFQLKEAVNSIKNFFFFFLRSYLFFVKSFAGSFGKETPSKDRIATNQ